MGFHNPLEFVAVLYNALVNFHCHTITSPCFLFLHQDSGWITAILQKLFLQEQQRESSNWFNSSSDNDRIKAQYSNSVSLNIRYNNYTTFMTIILHLWHLYYIYDNYTTFMTIILYSWQLYINTCYTTNNKNGEKSRFVNHFSLQDWLQLTNSQKHGHQLEVTRAMVNILNSVFEKEFSHTFQKAMIVAHNLSTQESSKEKGKNVEKSVRQTNKLLPRQWKKMTQMLLYYYNGQIIQ